MIDTANIRSVRTLLPRLFDYLFGKPVKTGNTFYCHYVFPVGDEFGDDEIRFQRRIPPPAE